jgi:hypothetical protein
MAQSSRGHSRRAFLAAEQPRLTDAGAMSLAEIEAQPRHLGGAAWFSAGDRARHPTRRTLNAFRPPAQGWREARAPTLGALSPSQQTPTGFHPGRTHLEGATPLGLMAA